MRTRFRVIDHAEFVLIIVSRKEETILLDKQTKSFFKSLFHFKKGRKLWHCICEKENLYHWRRCGISSRQGQLWWYFFGIYWIWCYFWHLFCWYYRRTSFVLIRGWFSSKNNCSAATNNPLEKEVKKKTKTQVTFNGFLNHLYIIQNNLLLLEDSVFVKITYRQIQ